jgi:hypothetical protein
VTRDQAEELLRDVHEYGDERTVYIGPGTPEDFYAALDAYRDWLAAEEDPDSYADPEAAWQCEERERVRDRARCDLMDAIDRLIKEAA